MKATTVTGYTIDGEAFCATCLDKRFQGLKGSWVERLMRMMENLSPVFASDEHDLTCDDCHKALGK
jgi:hypothetical protein